MKYFLIQNSTGKRVPIDEARYQSLIEAKGNYSRATRVEENFDVVMENFFELEEALFHVAMSNLVFGSHSRKEFDTARNLIDRRLTNLFSSTRLYKDALLFHSLKFLGKGDAYSQLKAAITERSPETIPFRIVETVRNYSQHQALPLSSITMGSKWHSSPERQKERATYSVTPKINAAKISKHRDLHPDVRQAMLDSGDKVEVMPLVRQNVERWGRINAQFRELSKTRLDFSETIIRKAIEETEGDNPSLTLAVAEDEKGQHQSSQLFLEFFEQLRSLSKKNGSQVNLARRFVGQTT